MSLLALAGHNLRSLDGAHFGNPTRGGLNLADRSKLIRRITRDADVVGTLENELDVANLEDLGAALLGVLAGNLKDIVYEGICHAQHILPAYD